MLSPVSVGLKFGFLAVLYLFLMWVAMSSFFDLRRGARRASALAAEETGLHDAPAGVVGASDLLEPRLVVDHAAGHEPGLAYDLSRAVTLGRGDVEIQLDDQFASSHHARISRQGHAVVLEDLGSTNGTFLNDEQLTGPQPLHDGDRIRIGDSQFTYLQ